jgi:hypothetical protein
VPAAAKADDAPASQVEYVSVLVADFKVTLNAHGAITSNCNFCSRQFSVLLSIRRRILPPCLHRVANASEGVDKFESVILP